ncbi:MAG: Rha family transcriptional regulator [Clostridium botulinum]|uniref:Rha family transcriptional regulator n=1 Tax=Clostridium sporogenes TaxID=1509 RepID=UPI001C608974|nr:Rha family transcriptional regulator [Clostridium sporogenes]MBW5456573.1 hypothetical protein [Clostridium sporogenes]MDU2834259.1 Rha family transcriptional regulator [Clostridium botulinum]
MKHLIIEKPTLDSREVAEMMELKHDKLIRKIDGINKDFTDTKIGVSKYWVETKYKDASGKSNRNFQITKRGCEFLAHKTTGTKGNLFTDKYMDRFEQMENYINNNKVVNSIKAEVTTLIDDIVSQKILEIEEKCSGYYRPSSFEKYNISQYIKKRLEISKANEEYELVKQRVLIKLNATKWEDIPIELLRDSLNIIDESIRVIKADRTTNQISLFEIEHI